MQQDFHSFTHRREYLSRPIQVHLEHLEADSAEYAGFDSACSHNSAGLGHLNPSSGS